MRAGIMIYMLVFVTGHTFGLGSDYINNSPVNNNPSWPEGVANLVNTTNRVHGFFVNDEDIFFFSGSATNLTTFLADYSQIQGVEKHRLILHDGVGEAKSPWEKTGRACDWELNGCSKWYRDLATLASHATNSLELTQQANQGKNYGYVLVGTNGAIKIIDSQKAGRATNYVLVVHFWTGGKIALDDVIIPKNVEVNISDEDKSTRLTTEANEAGAGNSVTAAIPPPTELFRAAHKGL